MRRELVLAATLAVTLGACGRQETANTPANECLEARSVDARIAACTSAAEDETLTSELRSEALSVRAGAQAESGDVTAALRDYGAAIELDGENPSALLGRGRILMNSGQLDAAEPLLRRAINIGPTGEAHTLLGEVLLRRGAFADAIASFDAALALDARQPRALAGRGRAKQRSGDVDGAAQDYDRAISLDGNLADARAGRCWLDLNRQRELSRARSDADAAVAADATHIEAQLCRGVLQLREGEWASARGSFDAVLAIESGNPIALFGRGVARRRSGDRQGTEDMNLARDFDGNIGAQFDDLGVRTY